MKILVVSDTHGNYPQLIKSIELAGNVDMFIHLGDGSEDICMASGILEVPVTAIMGNCDHSGNMPRELMLELEGKKLLLTHGDAYWVKKGLHKLEKHGQELGVDAVIYGHTHKAGVEMRSGITFINPGTLMKGAVCHTFAIVSLTEGLIEAEITQIS